MHKPLKIVRKVADAKLATAVPGIVTAQKRPIKIVHPLSSRGQAAIQSILAGKKPGEAMKEAGFADATSKNPQQNLLSQPAAVDEITKFVNKLIKHRDDVMLRMETEISEANYTELSMSLNYLIKNIQLLTGKATGKMGFDLPPEQMEAIKAIVGLNTTK